MYAQFSDALKEKVLELHTKDETLSAKEIAQRINKMASFKDERSLSSGSVYWILKRYGNGATKRNKSRNGQRCDQCYVREFMTSIGPPESGMVTLTFTVPAKKYATVLRQLKIVG